MAQYTMKDVKISGCYSVNEILDLDMNVCVNNHGFLTYGGLISEEAARQYIQQSADRQVVKVSLRDEVEFCGFPQKIETTHHNDHCYLLVTLVSSSQLMDIQPNDRFFQDPAYTYEDVLTEAYEDSGIGNLVAIRGKLEYACSILQYRETDWMYTLRMAGRLDTIVVPNISSVEPQVTLGVPNRQTIEETNNIVYSIRRNASGYRDKYLDSNRYLPENRVIYRNFLGYKLISENRYRLGDSVNIGGMTLVVMQKSLSYENGELVEVYILGHEKEFAVPFHQNKHIAGLELEGKVLEREGQRVKLLLDIDAQRKDCGKTWYSYSPVTNNGMYSVPLKDEKGILQWQSDVDGDVLVVRPDRKNSQDMLDFNERHFLTEHENHLLMIPNKVEFINSAGSLKWLSSKGFDISSDMNISITAQQDVIVESQAQVQVYSPERITASKAGVESSIDMLSNEMHIKAVEKTHITSKVNQYKKTKLPEKNQKSNIDVATASIMAAAVPQVSSGKK